MMQQHAHAHTQQHALAEVLCGAECACACACADPLYEQLEERVDDGYMPSQSSDPKIPSEMVTTTDENDALTGTKRRRSEFPANSTCPFTNSDTRGLIAMHP